MANYSMEHNHSWLGLLYTGIGFILTKIFIAIPEISNIAGIITILVGSTTIFINWPKIKERANEVINKFKRKK